MHIVHKNERNAHAQCIIGESSQKCVMSTAGSAAGMYRIYTTCALGSGERATDSILVTEHLCYGLYVIV